MRYRYLWTIISSLLLSAAFGYTLMDAFVFRHPLEGLYLTAAPAPLATVTPEPAPTTKPGNTPTAKATSTAPTATPKPTPTPEPAPVWQSSYTMPFTDEEIALYDDEQIYIQITKSFQYDSMFYIAHIMLKDVNYLQTAFADGLYGRNYTEHTSKIAKENDALLAISGDYYGFRDTGLVLRNGVLYRGLTSKDALAIFSDGDMRLVNKNTHTAQELLDAGAVQGLEFGPVLVKNGEVTGEQNSVSRQNNPRCAVGQIAPLDYLFVVVEGRSDTSVGVSCDKLAAFFVEYGCETAYNLDGGGTATMWYMGDVLNNPTYGAQRPVSDIIYIGKQGAATP